MNYGFIKKEEIWEWAFRSIKTTEIYDEIFLDLIDGNEPDGRQIDYVIKTRTEKDSTNKSVRILIGFISQYLTDKKIGFTEAADLLYNLCFRYETEFDSQEWNSLYHFEYAIYFETNVISGNLNPIKKDLIRTIKPYEKLKLDNYKNWEMYNHEINNHINACFQQRFSSE